MTLPILLDHNPSAVIGKATAERDHIAIEFPIDSNVTAEQALAAFGSFKLIESAMVGDRQIVLKLEVFEFSIST